MLFKIFFAICGDHGFVQGTFITGWGGYRQRGGGGRGEGEGGGGGGRVRVVLVEPAKLKKMRYCTSK